MPLNNTYSRKDMYRKIIKDLKHWCESSPRKPLILQGVRQCGKTWILREFAKTVFSDVAYFNFETDPQLQNIFNRDLNIDRIIRDLGDCRHQKIDPQTTALIFDEIQLCPAALSSLKYFHETCPKLAIMCAGSLLGIALASPTSFPVGKVSFMRLYPMDFEEFLRACGKEYLANHLSTASSSDMLSSVLFNEFSDMYYEYLIVGGMPEAVNKWADSRSIEAVDEILSAILESYELDFLKHAPHSQFAQISAVWKSIPIQLAKENCKFQYKSVLSNGRARTLSDALEWLNQAGLIHSVSKVEHPMIPLSTVTDLTSFKIYLCDVGLLRKLSKFPIESIQSTEQNSRLMRGALAENFVCTELLSAHISVAYYWTSGNRAELEFIVPIGTNIVPVEVKARAHTNGKSLAVYRNTYHPAYAVRFSMKQPGNNTDEMGVLLSLPLFAASCLERICSHQQPHVP